MSRETAFPSRKVIPFVNSMTHRRIGIAGYMGAGKSTVARLLAHHAGAVINADREAKSLMQESPRIRNRLVEAFGTGVVERREIRFDLLGQAAFASEATLLRLNMIVHPPLVKILEKRISESHNRLVILDAALLPLWHLESLFDVCLWVHAPFQTRLRRILAGRPDLNTAITKGRMRLQERMLPEPTKASSWIDIDNSKNLLHLAAELAIFR
jgi:dephospho-CoA kinase